ALRPARRRAHRLRTLRREAEPLRTLVSPRALAALPREPRSLLDPGAQDTRSRAPLERLRELAVLARLVRSARRPCALFGSRSPPVRSRRTRPWAPRDRLAFSRSL